MTPSAEELAVLRLGLCTPLGLTTRTTQVEMAAGTVRFFLTDVLDTKGEAVRASRLSLLEPHRSRTERIISLAMTALQECLEDAPWDEAERLPLFLALPASGSGAGLEEAPLLEALAEVAVPHRLQLDAAGLCREGRAGFFVALVRAVEALRAGRTRRVLVGAIDSLCDPVSLRHLLAKQRLRSSTVRDGILPGEGAGFVLLTRASLASRQGTAPLGRILAVATAMEPCPMTHGRPSAAEGLTTVFRQRRKHPTAGSRRVAQVMSCQTGETFWGHEFNRAYLRNTALMPEPLRVDLVAETLGDAGAGSGVIQLGQALHVPGGLATKRASVPRALVYGSSDEGQVGACIIERTP